MKKHYHSHTQEQLASVRHLIDASILDQGRGDGISPARQRFTIACNNCAKSKTKCDHKHPCGRCSIRGLVCETRPSKRARSSFANFTNELPTTLQTHQVPDIPNVAEGLAIQSPGSDVSQTQHQNTASNLPAAPTPIHSDEPTAKNAVSGRAVSAVREGEPQEAARNYNHDQPSNGDSQWQNAPIQLQSDSANAQERPVSHQQSTPAGEEISSRAPETGNWDWTAALMTEANSRTPDPFSVNLEHFSPPTQHDWPAIPDNSFPDNMVNYGRSRMLGENSSPHGNESDNACGVSLFALDLTFDQYSFQMVNPGSFMSVDGVGNDQAVTASLGGSFGLTSHTGKSNLLRKSNYRLTFQPKIWNSGIYAGVFQLRGP